MKKQSNLQRRMVRLTAFPIRKVPSTSFPSLLNSIVFVIAYVKSLVVKIVWFASEWLYGFVLPYLQVYCSWRPVRRREFAGAIAVIDDVLCLMIVLPH